MLYKPNPTIFFSSKKDIYFKLKYNFLLKNLFISVWCGCGSHTQAKHTSQTQFNIVNELYGAEYVKKSLYEKEEQTREKFTFKRFYNYSPGHLML